jgi:type II secretory pathway pseudopilin PulG
VSVVLGLLLNPTVLAIIAGILGALGWGWKQRSAGAAKERAKREAADRMVEDIADQVQSDVGSMSPEQIDAELRKRAKR